VTDVPCSGRPVILLMQARRFFCTTPRCPRCIFVERLPALVAPGARRSHGVQAALTRIGFAAGGEAGARLAQPLGYPVTPPSAVSIDDDAVRKGKTYGTVLCDLEQDRPLDLLPDRDADAVAAWFAARPSITIVSRDRGQVYREGVTRGARQATQVADRWHLAHNLCEALERVFQGERDVVAAVCLREESPTPDVESQDPRGALATDGAPLELRVAALQATEGVPSAHSARYHEVRRLHQDGYGLRTIATRLGLSRHTARAYVRASAA